jgi:hypothetical protein
MNVMNKLSQIEIELNSTKAELEKAKKEIALLKSILFTESKESNESEEKIDLNYLAQMNPY